MTGFVPMLGAACSTAGFLGVHLYDGLRCDGGGLVVDSLQAVVIIVANIIRLLLVLGGVAAVIMIIIGGIMYITSTGEPAKISKAKSVITNAIIGLVIALSAFAIVTSLAGVFK